tara:strand:- start:19950 stop:20825 length:876 start_codon:yes stop_codon:yes gene_type:complete
MKTSAFLTFGYIIILLIHTTDLVNAQTESIIYTNKVGRNANLHTVNLDGSNNVKITGNPSSDSAPSYSPKGDFIVFNSERNGWWKIWKMNSDGSELEQVSFPGTGADYDPTISPNGNIVAFTSSRDKNEEIYIKRINENSPSINLTKTQGDQRYPRWISNNEILYYDTSGEHHIIMTMNLSGEIIREFNLGLGNNYMGDISKNGDLVFTSDRDGSNDLYILFSNEKEPVKITESEGLIDYRAKWSVDGNKIVYERSNRKNISQIWVYDLISKTLKQHTKSGYNYYPSWVIR